MENLELTHINEQGRACMVDVTQKDVTFRQAEAEGRVRVNSETLALIRTGGTPKGDVLAVAQVAGILAAKRTHELIPMCHPLRLTAVDISFTLEETAVHIRSQVKCRGETGNTRYHPGSAAGCPTALTASIKALANNEAGRRRLNRRTVSAEPLKGQ